MVKISIKTQENLEYEVWGDVEIICPICRSKKYINIPKRIIEQAKQLTSILIPVGRICDHAFVPFIDKQFKVRGYQKLDALLNDLESKIAPPIELKPESIDIIEIKMNIRPEMMIYAIQGTIFKKKVLIVIDKKLEYLKDTLFDFLDYIFQNSFDTNIMIKSKEDFKRTKKLYNEYLVLEGKNIVGKEKINIDLKDLNIEEELIVDFYREGDSVSSLKNLKDKLRQLYALTQKLLGFYKKHCIQHPLIPKKAIRYLEDTHFIKVKKSYFQLLIKIINNYFNTKIVLVQDKTSEMLKQMWGE